MCAACRAPRRAVLAAQPDGPDRASGERPRRGRPRRLPVPRVPVRRERAFPRAMRSRDPRSQRRRERAAARGGPRRGPRPRQARRARPRSAPCQALRMIANPFRALVALAALASGLAAAQTTWPDKPVQLVVPFPAGGGVDVIARPFAEQFGALLGQPVVVAPRDGASGTIGMSVVAAAKPDGYT